MKKLLWISIAIVGVVSMLHGAHAAPAPTKVYQWRLQAFYPPSEEKFVISLAEFPKYVDRATNGQIKITLYPAGALVPPRKFSKVWQTESSKWV